MESLGQMLISLGAIFLAGLVFDAIGRHTLLPRVTLLLVFGFAVGPSALDLMPDITSAWFPGVAHIALAMVGFLLGGGLTPGALAGHGRQVISVSVVVVLTTFVVVGLGLVAIGVPSTVALLLGAIATATAPAAMLGVVHEAHSDSPFSRTLLAIVALDDAWGLIVFGGALAFAHLLVGDGATQVLIHGAWELGGALALGLALGVPMAFLTGRLEPGEPTLYEALGLVLLCCGIAVALGVSFLLACMTMGTVVANLARHHTRPFHAIEGIEWPFMLVFFVLAGASLELEALSHASGWLAAYVALRVLGRLLGGWLGGSLPPSDPLVRRWMGIALLPQAGVALGMALVASQRLPAIGEAILPLVVAATVVFEIVGPIAARIALQRTSGAPA
jgi:Kef-type K+ transport system membrane component KefB